MPGFHRPYRRLAAAAAVALIAAFALAGCGRKGPLDPPPGAASATGQQRTSNTDLIRSPFGQAGQKTEAAPQPPNKAFVLDPLLN